MMKGPQSSQAVQLQIHYCKALNIETTAAAHSLVSARVCAPLQYSLLECQHSYDKYTAKGVATAIR
eukprot:9698-Heterococcus_DN1.PRE.9